MRGSGTCCAGPWKSCSCSLGRPTRRPGSGLSVSLLLAVMADRVVKGARLYRTLLVWPYAVAPVVAGTRVTTLSRRCVSLLTRVS